MSDSIKLSKAKLIDIGANLSHESFHDDLDSVLQRARNVNIENIILTGTCLETSTKAIELCKRYPDYLYSTVGLHPHEASKYNDDLGNSFRQLVQNPCVKSLGEAGLDYNRNYSSPSDQEKAFSAQLALAVELGLPIFLHQRDAHSRFLPILKEFRSELNKVVVHCFTGNKEELYDYLDMDLHIGITGWVCDERRGYSLHPLLKDIPNNRLMMETDAPYLMPRNITPKPKTRRNEPENLIYVLDMVAKCLNISPERLAAQTSSNARDFFDL